MQWYSEFHECVSRSNTGSCFAFGEYNFYCYFKYNIYLFPFDIDFLSNSTAQIHLLYIKKTHFKNISFSISIDNKMFICPYLSIKTILNFKR